jgi:hypothetical protein
MSDPAQPMSKTGHQLVFLVSSELYDRLEAIRAKRGRKFHMADVCRDGLRNYVDQQEDIIGSRAHFTKTLRERFDALETSIQEKLDQHFTQLGRLVLTTNPTLPAPSSQPSSNPGSISNLDSELLFAELHTMLHLLTTCFAPILARIQNQKEITADSLLDAAILHARSEALLYETKLCIALEQVEVNPVDKDQLLSGQ